MEPLSHAPVAAILVGGDDVISGVNIRATKAGFETGENINTYLAGLEEKFVDFVRYQPDSHIYHLRFTGGEKKYQARFEEKGDHVLVWWLDMTEQLALADQVRRLKYPDSRKLRQINQLAITAAGYSELLEVIFSEEPNVSPDKLNTVRQYQHELTGNLSAIHEIIANDQAEPRRGSVLVADGHNAVTELISELLKTRGYRVAGFSDAETALKYFQVNQASIVKAVIDEALMCDETTSLVSRLRELSPELGVVILSDTPTQSGSIAKPLDFNVLLAAVEG